MFIVFTDTIARKFAKPFGLGNNIFAGWPIKYIQLMEC